jgi:hypothetical protein
MPSPTIIDIISQRFGRLTALRPVEKRDHKYFWLCICDCGKKVVVQGKKLRNSHTRSCGCLKKESHLVHGESRKGHETREYQTWKSMLLRCKNSSRPDFKYYGGRGIKICKRWLQYENFLADMGRRPGKGYSIERINNEGNYTPSNCKWATHVEQMNNTRRTRRAEIMRLLRLISERPARAHQPPS